MFNKIFLEKFIEYENATKLFIIKWDDMKPPEKKLFELIEKQKKQINCSEHYSKFEIGNLKESISNLQNEIREKEKDTKKTYNTLKEKEKIMNDFFYEIFKVDEQMNGMSFIQTLKFKGFENIKEYLYFLQRRKCCYCNKKIRLKQMTREHLIPKSSGGSNLIFNICLVCNNCNKERGCILCNQKSIKELYRRFCNPMWWY